MMNNNISRFADLDREEIRVKKRIRKQEEVIKLKMQTLPEEIISKGVSKVIASILSGDILKSAVSIIKTVGSSFINSKKEGATSGGGIIDIIKTVIKNKLSI
jgi:hypothetical protein